MPDYQTKNIIYSQKVICGHTGCSKECSLQDVIVHMKRCKFRKDKRSLLSGAIKRCRDEIETMNEETNCKKRRQNDVIKVLNNYRAENCTKGSDGTIAQAVNRFVSGLRNVVGKERFERLYREECMHYHQEMVDSVKAATSA